MPQPSWNDQPELWDTVYLNGVALPGVAAVEATVGRKMDVRSPPGADGATIVDKGYKPAEIKITLTLYLDAHIAAWESLQASLNPRRDLAHRVAYSISHPALAQVGVRRAYVTAVAALTKGTVPQTWTTTISALEYSPPSRRATTTVARQGAEAFGQTVDPRFSGTQASGAGPTPAPPSTASAGP